jgi:predicted nucleotidyltransferase
MPQFGLSDTTVAAIREVFADYPSIISAVLYGSRAMGNFKPGSDIDLTLIGHDLNLSLVSEIAARLEELPIPYQIDLTAWEHIDHTPLKEHIERVGVVFYQRVLSS